MKTLKDIFAVALLTLTAASCSMMDDDLPPCPQGLDVHFKYDYNLERADMFTDHVGSVTVYVCDLAGNVVATKTESNTATAQPLRSHDYAMHFDIQPGTYTLRAVAFQKPYADCLATSGAKFRLAEPAVGEDFKGFTATLDNEATTAPDTFAVANAAMPLDTLWRELRIDTVTVVEDVTTSDTVSLIRDTKHINVVLRSLDDPAGTDVENFAFRIYDRNALLLADNAVDETKQLVYTPYATWNTEDKVTKADTEDAGRMAHADFMTSRILDHGTNAEADGILSIVNLTTGHEVVRVNLPDMLARLRISADRYKYSVQEFLDRGYDYHVTFFLKGDTWSEASISISVLSWSVRFQNENL